MTSGTPGSCADVLAQIQGYVDGELDAVESTWNGSGVGVFFVNNPISIYGGAATTRYRTNAKAVVCDAGTSTTLLAHEMGHALGLGHPPDKADPGTVMEPTGNPDTDNPKRNTMGNYDRITWHE